MLVSESGTGEAMTPEVSEELWMKLRNLSPNKRDILVCRELPQKLLILKEKLNLDEKAIGRISLVIRKIFFNELDLAGAEAKIASMLGAGGAENPNHAKAIVEFIKKEILTIKPVKEVVPDESLSSEPVIKTARLPLLKAMSEYPHLSEQLLTREKIKLKSSTEPVRPSLGNWLKSYREELGIGFHEPVKRGNFLFQSQNGKRLSNEERARFNLILKSVEEEFPLDIDTERQAIVFPSSGDVAMELTQIRTNPSQPTPNRMIRARGLSTSLPASETTPETSSPTAFQSFKPLFAKSVSPEKNVSGETLHFSTGHVLPAEREAGAPTSDGSEALRQMQHPTQGIRREPNPALSRSPYSIRPLRPRSGDNENA